MEACIHGGGSLCPGMSFRPSNLALINLVPLKGMSSTLVSKNKTKQTHESSPTGTKNEAMLQRAAAARRAHRAAAAAASAASYPTVPEAGDADNEDERSESLLSQES